MRSCCKSHVAFALKIRLHRSLSLSAGLFEAVKAVLVLSAPFCSFGNAHYALIMAS